MAGYKAPMACMALLIPQRSCINVYFPLAWFSITKLGLFHGLLEGSTCPAFSCCSTKIWAYSNFFPKSGHRSIHISSLINHLSGIAVGQDFISVAPRRGSGYKNNQGHCNRRTLGKGLSPRSYDCLILLNLGKSLLPRLSFVRGESNAQLLHYVSPPISTIVVL
jgi:hypothetical protein